MATHYNEPIDIASSSLTEHGTVYGGEENLIKGVKNLITLYKPKAIGVLTTCLAETIGEDINRIINKMSKRQEIKKVKFIPVSSAGYAGTNTDGFESAARAAVESIAVKKAKDNGYINIVMCETSCADVRFIKEVLDDMGVKYVLLPDISDNLDRPHLKKYEKLSLGGTKLSDIKKMSGAKHAVQIGMFTPDKLSAAQYLYEKFGVPYTKCNMPLGFENSLKFFETISKISGRKIPEKYILQKGRMLDAMVDSHKYNAAGRAAIFGEPELAYCAACLCLENGILPVICATGSKCKEFKPALEERIRRLAALKLEDNFYIADNADFSDIEEAVKEFKPNILIGSSDARRIEEKTGVQLVRIGFPIHDRVGGQRQLKFGFNGSLNILDEITNALIKKTADAYRQFNYETHFKGGEVKIFDSFETGNYKENAVEGEKSYKDFNTPNANASLQSKPPNFASLPRKDLHPCFNCAAAHTNARLHLPIAPACNISCNYCLRKYDCANESRPGVASSVLTPQQALKRFEDIKKNTPNLTVAGIAGPGDALANFDAVKETLSQIRKIDKDIIFCLSTNGLMLPFYAGELINLGVSHVTITINAADAGIGEKIYSHIDYLGERIYGRQAAEILLKNQLDGLRFLSGRGVICKVNIVVLSGINEHSISDIAALAKDGGAAITNIMQMIPVKNTVFENLPLVNMAAINEKRKECQKILPQMFHCKQCRADAVGILGDDKSIDFLPNAQKLEKDNSCAPQKPVLPKVKYAAASKSGILIDLHFGMAEEFYIYEYSAEDKTFNFIEKRAVEKYCSGKTQCLDKEDKIGKIIFTIKDCKAVLCLRIGDNPAKKLSKNGIAVYETYDRIEDALKQAAKGGEKIRKAC
jgi:nitrogenase molybdenum-iron protein alpha/beta subunit/molybdenum cofactor biosynthesis enzyme MoaA